ncbi:hypothetical protein AB0O91_00185 [Kitasatospora sp. NPDC089797]|uniref:hypothetical protein n=1 Tax=Kitasatospora sp. NPDC089797 TaxID=3155298 RepID=UPI003433860B
MSPKRNLGYGARRARAKQQADTTDKRYTELRFPSGGRTPAVPEWEPTPGRYVNPDWARYGNPFIPPPGSSPADDPYGRAHRAVSVPFLLNATVEEQLPGGRDGLEAAAEALRAGCRFLVRDGRWYRATASVYGPLPMSLPSFSDRPAPGGYVNATWLVCLVVRRPDDDPQRLIADAHASILGELARRAPAPAGHKARWYPVPPAQADLLMRRLPWHARTAEDVHPSLLPDSGDVYGGFAAGFPQRLVDSRSQGWRLVGEDGYAADFGKERGLGEMDYDALAAVRGPLSPVVEPDGDEAALVRDTLVAAGRRAVASLLVALYKVDQEQRAGAQEWGAVVGSLYAGDEGADATCLMRDLVAGLGADVCAQPQRWDQECVEELVGLVCAWTETTGAYTEVAATFAVQVTAAAEQAGGWEALADDELCPLTSSRPAVAARVQRWLMPAAASQRRDRRGLRIAPLRNGGSDKTSTTVDLRAGLALYDNRARIFDIDAPGDLPRRPGRNGQE